MITKSNKIRSSVTHNDNSAPWWGDLLGDIVEGATNIGTTYINSKNAPAPQVTPQVTPQVNNNTSNNNTLLYAGIGGGVLLILLVVLLKK